MSASKACHSIRYYCRNGFCRSVHASGVPGVHYFNLLDWFVEFLSIISLSMLQVGFLFQKDCIT